MSHIIFMSRVLLDDLSDIIKTSNGSETWRNLVTYKNMLRAVESMAVEMSFGIIFIGNGKLSTADFARFIESHKVGQYSSLVHLQIFSSSSLRSTSSSLKDSSAVCGQYSSL